MSLRSLINLRIVLSVVVILLLGSITAVWQARQSVAKEVQSSITLAVQMIEFGFAQTSHDNKDTTTWLSQITALQQARHLQISLAQEGEKPIRFVPQDMQDNIRDKPPQWFVRAVMTKYFTERYSVEIADGSTKTILITADPLDEITEAWGETKVFFWSVVAMLSAIFLAVNLVFNSMLRAVQSILAGLQQVEQGKYDITIPQLNIGEFDDIAAEVNEMSKALKTAQDNNQALARHTMHIQETERQNMSRELHDEMGQSLTAIKAMTVTSKQGNVDVATTAADSIIEICDHLANVVRSMMRTLHPLSLSELGLGATLLDLTNEWQRRHPKLNIEFHYDDRVEVLDDKVAIHVYRVVQECLTNVVRHANASEVKVTVEWASLQGQPRVELTVSDNGIGGDAGTQGFGVLGMRERIENLGGQFGFKSNEDKGISVKAWMPFISAIT